MLQSKPSETLMQTAKISSVRDMSYFSNSCESHLYYPTGCSGKRIFYEKYSTTLLIGDTSSHCEKNPSWLPKVETQLYLEKVLQRVHEENTPRVRRKHISPDKVSQWPTTGPIKSSSFKGYTNRANF